MPDAAQTADAAAPGRLGGLLGRGFRPFFLLGAAYATGVVWLWAGVLAGWLAPGGRVGSTAWHGHEMLFGFAAAAIAGFLLTAVPNWTGRPALHGAPLAALAALWLAGRMALAAVAMLPPLAVALVDLAFLPVLALVITPPIVAAGKPKNLLFPALLACLAVANGCVHAEWCGLAPGLATPALRTSVFGVALLVAVLGARITPGFTSNALARAGSAARARSLGLPERLATPALLVFVALDLLWPTSRASGAAAAATALLLAARMSGWQTLRVLRDPLVWSLHLGYAWLVFGFACLAIAGLGASLPPLVGLHALAAGGFGTMILAVATRVALGHTGRPLVAPPSAVAAYALVTLGALLRLAGVLRPGLAAPLPLVPLAGLVWGSAFAVFLAGYARVLLEPRIDGRPG